MDDEALAEYLELLAERLGVQVRFEDCDGPGGLCLLRGEKILFVHHDIEPEDQVLVMGSALCTLDLDSVFIVPEVREFLESMRRA